MALNAKKKVPINRLMSFENSAVPLSMFTEDGSMCSTPKSEFLHKLEGLITEKKITQICDADCIIVNGHAIIQMLPVPTDNQLITFKTMAQEFQH